MYNNEFYYSGGLVFLLLLHHLCDYLFAILPFFFQLVDLLMSEIIE